MSKTIGLLVASAGTLTRTNGARGFDSSSSVAGGLLVYWPTNDFSSACSALDKGLPVTGSLINDGDCNGEREKIIVNTSVPGFLSSVTLFSTPFGKLKSAPSLTWLLVTPDAGNGFAVKKAVGRFLSPGPKM